MREYTKEQIMETLESQADYVGAYECDRVDDALRISMFLLGIKDEGTMFKVDKNDIVSISAKKENE